jgi:NADP-dependent 3-hydroxy acid dehydrogenase YdfG
VGAATGRLLAERGVTVALVARRAERLDDLAGTIEANGGFAHPVPADLSRPQEAERAMDAALGRLGGVDALVNCLGTNLPERGLDRLSVADWDMMIATNLSAVFYCVHAVLPAMRAQGNGSIVSISSIAGLRPSTLSGAAYSAAKAGLNALAASINLEEAGNGIRSCVICPGDIDTELLERRPNMPPREARARMLTAEDIAQMIWDVLSSPPHLVVQGITVVPRSNLVQ